MVPVLGGNDTDIPIGHAYWKDTRMKNSKGIIVSENKKKYRTQNWIQADGEYYKITQYFL